MLLTGKKLLEKPALVRIVQMARQVLLGFLCSIAVVYGRTAPFGVAVTAAAGSGTMGLLTLLGSAAGYLLLWEGVDSLKYIAINVLVFAGLFVFRGLSIAQKALFMPLTVLVSSLFVGIVFVAGGGFGLPEAALFAAELALMTGGAYLFREALQTLPAEDGADAEKTPALRRGMGGLLLTAVCLLALTPLKILGVILPARAIAVLLTLWHASKGGALTRSGAGAGSATGITLGVAMDLALGRPYFSMAYGISGLIGGVFIGAGRLWVTGSFVVVSALSALWAGDGALRLAALAETFIGSVFFVALPEAVRTAQSARQDAETAAGNPAHEERVRAYVRSCLTSESAAFGELHEALRQTFEQFAARKDDDMSGVFDRAAAKICRKCALTGVCWDREVDNTCGALNEASRLIEQNNSASQGDFPAYFASRCLQFPAWVKAVNEELGVLAYRRQYRARLRESRRQICDQYAEMSRLLHHAAEEACAELAFDPDMERRIKTCLAPYDADISVCATRLGGGRRSVDLEGADLSALLPDMPMLLTRMQEALGFPFTEPEQQRGIAGDRLLFREAEALSATIGVAAHRKHGQKVSGDSGTYFKTMDGKFYVLLSDGMGSGRAAALESGLTVRLLERFLRAGISPETSLRTLNSALILRGEDNVGFVTVDLLVVNLLTGDAELHKYGAAPSYLRRGEKVARIRCKALPAGLGLSGEPQLDVTRFRMNSGDVLLLASDGVSDASGDSWLQSLLLSSSEEPPKQQAAKILEMATSVNGRGDDMTALVVHVKAG